VPEGGNPGKSAQKEILNGEESNYGNTSVTDEINTILGQKQSVKWCAMGGPVARRGKRFRVREQLSTVHRLEFRSIIKPRGSGLR
jgi:hypothetical protein